MLRGDLREPRSALPERCQDVTKKFALFPATLRFWMGTNLNESNSSLLPLPEDGSTDPHDGRSLGDGHFEVVRHAHGKLG
jgi:hypothetical protein